MLDSGSSNDGEGAMKHAEWMLLGAAMFAGQALAASCPAEGERYVVKGFTGDTPVKATGGEVDPKWGCRFLVEDSDRELWWDPAEVVPAGGTAATAATTSTDASGAGGGETPAIGSVWECTLPGIGLFTGAYFGIVDGSTYRDFDGRTGNYEFDPGTGVLRLTSGSSRGLTYKRQSPRNFRVLDDAGNITGGNCVHNSAKRIDGRW
jgi:hypothetical protein